MIPQRIAGETRVVGASQPEYQPLSLRDMPATLEHADGSKSTVNAMVSAWRPSDEELARLNAGEPILLSILGNVWPPASIWVAGA